MLIRFCGLTIEATRHSLYAAHSGTAWGLWIELRQADLSRVWSLQREPGSIEAWAGRVYAALDRDAPYLAISAIAGTT